MAKTKEQVEDEKIEAYALSLFVALKDLESDCGAPTRKEVVLILDDVRGRWEAE